MDKHTAHTVQTWVSNCTSSWKIRVPTRDSLYTFYRSVFMKRAITISRLAFFFVYLATCFFHVSEYPRESLESSKYSTTVLTQCYDYMRVIFCLNFFLHYYFSHEQICIIERKRTNCSFLFFLFYYKIIEWKCKVFFE